MDTFEAIEIGEIKSEMLIDYMDYQDPTQMIAYDERPNLAPDVDVFAGVGDDYPLITDIKDEPGTEGNRTNIVVPVDVPLACRFCQIKFADRKQLDDHLSQHKDKEIFRCTKCSFKCIAENILIEHYKAFENDVNVPCIICKEEFARMCFLVNHMEEHRLKKEIRLPEGTLDLYDTSKPVTVLPCVNCDYKTASLDAMHKHLEPNEIGKLIKCLMCKEQFALRCDYYNHMKQHLMAKSNEM